MPCQFLKFGLGLLAEKLLDDLLVGGGEHSVLVEAALDAARLDFEIVTHSRALLLDLSGAGDLEALFRTRVGLLLRHILLFRYSAAAGVSGAAGAVFGAEVCALAVSAFASALVFSGAIIIVMLRPSTVGECSTVPNSATASANL